MKQTGDRLIGRGLLRIVLDLGHVNSAIQEKVFGDPIKQTAADYSSSTHRGGDNPKVNRP